MFEGNYIRNRAETAIPALLSACVYIMTLAPGLQSGDAGEQIAAAHMLGISHPSGTPLYLLLMKLWETIFPFGELAYKMNVLNALLGGVAIFTVSATVTLLCRQFALKPRQAFILAIFLPLGLAFSQTFWLECTAASSYILLAAFTAVWVYVFAESELSGTGRLARLYLISGLALAAHVLALALLLVTAALSVSWWKSGRMRIPAVLTAPFYLIPGLAFYLYIPLRAMAHPTPNWGTPDNFERLLAYLTRANYKQKLWVETLGDFAMVLEHQMLNFYQQIGPAGLVLILLAIIITVASGRNDGVEKKPAVLSLVSAGGMLFAANFLFMALHGSFSDLFYWPRYLLTGVLGLYFAVVVIVIAAVSGARKNSVIALLALSALLPASNFAINLTSNDRSENRIMEKSAQAVLRELPPGSAYFASGDNYLFPFLYYRYAENMRPDVTLVNPELGFGSVDDLPNLIARDSLYSSHMNTAEPPVNIFPAGLIYKVTVSGAKPTVADTAWPDYSPLDESQATGFLDRLVMTDAYGRRGTYLHASGNTNGAGEWFIRMEKMAQGYDASLQLAGLYYLQAGNMEKARELFAKTLAINRKNQTAKNLLEKLSPANVTAGD